MTNTEVPDSSDELGGAEQVKNRDPPVAQKASAEVQSPPPKAQPVRTLRHSMADMLIGTVLADRYRLLERIGEGAMGWVFLAEHTEIGKKCAVKVLRPSLCKLPEAVSRFRREARAASQIGSTHIVDVTDFGTTPNGAVFYAMEYLSGGEDLASFIKINGKAKWERVVTMLLQMCRALQAAHDEDIIHRDVKPANFYRVQPEGGGDFIKVLDFGIARLVSPKDSIVTATGVIMGTPDFMAPEQAQGKRVDHRADIYSLGATAYSLLTARPPFVGANEYDVIYKQLNEEPKAPGKVATKSGIPEWLDAAVLKAMRKDPDGRFQTMREFAAALEAREPAKAGAAAERAEAPTDATRARPEKEPGLLTSPAFLIGGAIGLAVAGGLAYYLLFFGT